jgi:hypothetical protein
LGSSRLKQAFLKVTEATTATLTLLFKNNFKISAIYAPPTTMNHAQFLSMLETVKNSDIISGDWNCHPPLLTASLHKHSSSQIKLQRYMAMETWADKNYKYLASTPAPNSTTSALDHTWTSGRINTLQYSWLDTISSKNLGLSSDHGTLWHFFDNFLDSAASETSSHQGAIRYHTNKLSRDVIKEKLLKNWETAARRWCDTLDSVDPLNLTKTLVNPLNTAMVQSITHACETALGRYSQNTKQSSDRNGLAAELEKMSNTRTASQTFKRACRGSATTLVSSGETTVMEEAVTLFKQVYTSDTAHHSEYPEFNNYIYTIGFSFSFLEVHRAVYGYSNAKAPGQDGIHQLVLKVLCDNPWFLALLTATFNHFLQVQCTPSDWNETLIFLLPKESGKTCTVNKTRPLSMTVILRRIFEKLLMEKITGIQEDWNKLHPCQGGFQQGRSTDAHVALSHFAVTHPDSPCKLQVFLDIEKAFDRISHSYIIDTLTERDMPMEIMSLLYSLMLKGTSSRLLVNHATSTRDSARLCPLPLALQPHD